MNFRISKKNPLLWLYLVGAILLLGAALAWCFIISNNPERVFWKTIERGLATSGVTIAAKQTTNGTTADQLIRYSLGANNVSHSVTTLSQDGTTVKNEMIGTPTVDYSRYLEIKTTQKKADGSNIDVSKLLGVWAKGQEGSGQFFAQAVFGGSLPIGGMGVPIGNVSPEARARLVKQAKDSGAYTTDFAKVKKERVNGRMQYTYETTVKPAAYVALMKEFAQSLGLHGLDQVDPASYKDQPSFKLQITVDTKAQHVVRIKADDTKSEQSYSGYDVPVQVELPKQTITGQQLQQLLSEVQ